VERRKILEEFQTILQDRAELEDYYARNIERIGNGYTSFMNMG
jgi:hypothetical protein